MDRLTILQGLWTAWAAHGRAMTDDQWKLPTRAGAWDVRELYAHAASWPAALLPGLLAAVRDAEPTHPTAAALLRDFNAPSGNANRLRDWNAQAARDAAARYSPAQMTEQFAGAGAQVIASARRLGDVSVDYFGQAVLRLDEAVAIGVLEATVHLLDLQRAIGADPEVPAEALSLTAAVLTGMAPPVDLIEAATGRSAFAPVLT
jgi:mycothiol maleylpyruvate isomerase-like protein